MQIYNELIGLFTSKAKIIELVARSVFPTYPQQKIIKLGRISVLSKI